MTSQELREIPSPDNREKLIMYAHEKHGHFAIKRTCALLNYWWAGLHKDVWHLLNCWAVCDHGDTSFNVTAQQLSPLPIQGIF
eukprot:1154411-Pelagomonas_calceolata.AAC.2